METWHLVLWFGHSPRVNDQHAREGGPLGMTAQTAADRGREVRRQLLTAAAALIPEIGWNAVSTRNLAQRAGVAPGLIHYHFASLQALLREAAVGTMRRLLAETQSAFDGTESVEAGVEMMLAALDGYSGDDPTSLLFIETYLAATRDQELRVELTALVVSFRYDLARWLAERGQDMSEETASVLAAAIDGVMLHRPLNPQLTSAAVAPVLRKLLTSTNDGGSRTTPKAG